MKFIILYYKKDQCSVFDEKGTLVRLFEKIHLPEEIDLLKELDLSDEYSIIFISSSAGLEKQLYEEFGIIPFFEVFHFFFPLVKTRNLKEIQKRFSNKIKFPSKVNPGNLVSILFQFLIGKISKIDNRLKEIIINLTDGTWIHYITIIFYS